MLSIFWMLAFDTPGGEKIRGMKPAWHRYRHHPVLDRVFPFATLGP